MKIHKGLFATLLMFTSACASAQADEPLKYCDEKSPRKSYDGLQGRVSESSFVGLYRFLNATMLSAVSYQYHGNAYNYEFELIDIIKGAPPRSLNRFGVKPYEGNPPRFFFDLLERHEYMVNSGQFALGTNPISYEIDGQCTFLVKAHPDYPESYLVFGGIETTGNFEVILSSPLDALVVRARKLSTSE